MNPIQKITDRLARTSRKTRVVAAGAGVLALFALGATAVAPIAPDPADLPVKSVTEQLALPNLQAQISALQNDSQQFIHEERIRRGDSLGSVFTRLGIDDAQAQNFVRADKVAKRILTLKPGKRIQAETDENGLLLSLHATIDGKDAPSMITVTRKGDKFDVSEGAPQLERRIEMRSREISSSLYAATDSDADGGRMPDGVVNQIIEMFSNNIDFRSDLKRGDHFSVVYETFWQDGELVRTGRILAGEFVNRGTTYQSVWYEDPVSHQGGYYSLDGKSLKQGFLKSPVAYTRVSSGFSMRMHPVFGVWKQHTGIDLAAPMGTPIRAAGDGTVDFVGTQNGYGNIVVLKHWANYSTAYGHMSRFVSGLRKGEKVHQGDVIGYVGATGWATGPHLHYEFRVGGTAKDPNGMKVVAQAPLSSSELSRFKMAASDMSHRFSLLAPAGQAMAAR
ncbi:peptidoglycan DD-metalloendopeptidase family protein [Massilia terrae]|uniref:M23 family metallopeptidase n=1 Tax=Massilia terrae TaxID=1811224 RepID=A0ABT2D0F0_9BURK|nr:M23 family metallopeptidase [Massilia terrae]MCS0659698.1 M23 family metallopeptidase [Massilia terrae]